MFYSPWIHLEIHTKVMSSFFLSFFSSKSYIILPSPKSVWWNTWIGYEAKHLVKHHGVGFCRIAVIFFWHFNIDLLVNGCLCAGKGKRVVWEDFSAVTCIWRVLRRFLKVCNTPKPLIRKKEICNYLSLNRRIVVLIGMLTYWSLFSESY